MTDSSVLLSVLFFFFLPHSLQRAMEFNQHFNFYLRGFGVEWTMLVEDVLCCAVPIDLNHNSCLNLVMGTQHIFMSPFSVFLKTVLMVSLLYILKSWGATNLKNCDLISKEVFPAWNSSLWILLRLKIKGLHPSVVELRGVFPLSLTGFKSDLSRTWQITLLNLCRSVSIIPYLMWMSPHYFLCKKNVKILITSLGSVCALI